MLAAIVAPAFDATVAIASDLVNLLVAAAASDTSAGRRHVVSVNVTSGFGFVRFVNRFRRPILRRRATELSSLTLIV